MKERSRMNRFLPIVSLAVCVMAILGCAETGPSKVLLQSRVFSFEGGGPPAIVLDKGNLEGSPALPEGGLSSFTVKMSVDLDGSCGEAVLFEIPGVLTVRKRPGDPSDWNIQNYPSYRMPDGTDPVLEAVLTLRSRVFDYEAREMTVGIPLAVLDRPSGAHEVTLDFTGVRCSFYVDGILYDNDFALGYPISGPGLVCRLCSPEVLEASLWAPGQEAVQKEGAGNSLLETAASGGIQYWTPPYHNAWVGDVSAIWYKGRYHLFYLFDRRGHASKFGKGGHYFEHISTEDFRTWTEHEAAAPIEEQWETFGTGTPFVWNDSLYLSYGLHTTRMFPREETTLPYQWDYLHEHGKTCTLGFDDLKDAVPDGTTWSLCTDGVSHFEKSLRTVHPCENPSIYTDSDGNLRMLANYGARGTWASESPDGGWVCLDPDFPPGGDCTFPFTWGGYDYIVGGFTSLWGRPAGRTDLPWKDLVASGEDFYDGISVPSVTCLEDGRCIMAGWVKMRGWGGALVIHELVRLPDGALGSKWMDGLAPSSSTLISFEVVPDAPGTGRCSVCFQPEDGGEPCWWSLDLGECRAQYSSDPSSREKTLAEGGNVPGAVDYAIRNGIRTDSPIKVRMAVRSDPKFDGSLIDTEIGGTRTMVSFRRGLKVKDVSFHADSCRVKKVKIHKN